MLDSNFQGVFLNICAIYEVLVALLLAEFLSKVDKEKKNNQITQPSQQS